jgi:hypothetical protein
MPSVLRQIEEDVDSKSSHIVYKNKVAEQSDNHEAVSKPRDLKQVQNMRERVKNEKRVTKDAIINIHGLAHEDPSFVHVIQTWPDLLIVYGMKDMIDYTNDIMRLKDKNFYFTYDTTFTLGDFYKSVLIMRNITFQSMPATPVLFLLHKKKLTSCHNVFFEQFRILLPRHNNIPIVVDDEVAIAKSIKNNTDNKV